MNKNKRYLLLLYIFCIFSVLESSEDDGTFGYSGYDSEDNSSCLSIEEECLVGCRESVVKNSQPTKRFEDHFNSFYFAKKESANADDTDLYRWRMDKALFVQCCIQAQKNKTLDKKPFNELIERVDKGLIKEAIDIDTKALMVCMSEKDLRHRLLRFISSCKKIFLINNKMVTFQENHCPKRLYIAPQQLLVVRQESEKVTNEVVCVSEFQVYGYKFESNQKHHNQILKKYFLLFKK